MESQQIAPHHHHAPHNVQLHHQSVEGELEDEQHHEKKSVLKKVKAKAKKIKDTITKHGHPHDHDHDHHDYDYDDEDEDDEDEVVVEDPQLQGAPLYEGAAMRSGVGKQGHQQDVGIGMPTAMHNEPLPASFETTSRPYAVQTGYTTATTTTNKPTSKVVNSAVEPNTTMSMSPWSLVEDPNGPSCPHNSEVKAFDPSGKGSEEAGESQMFDSFAKMNQEDKPNRIGICNEKAGESQMFDSFAKMKVNQEDKPNRTGTCSEKAAESQMFDSFAKMKVDVEDKPSQTGTGIASDTHQAGNQSSYAQKISAVGSAMSEKAVAAKDFMASKLGYGEATELNANTNTKSTSALEYGKKIASTMTEKLKPGEEDRALSNVISESFNRRKQDQQQQQPQQPIVGKVTESDELTRRLGRDEGKERSGTAAAAVRTVADTVKDTIGSWMGNVGDQPPPSQQQSLGTRGVASQQKPCETEAEVRIRE